MTPDEAKAGLWAAISLVKHRLDDIDAPDADAFRADIAGITRARVLGDDAFCEWSARLGLDPHDPEELSDDLAADIQQLVAPLDASIRGDLLDATAATDLLKGCEWIEHAQRLAEGAGPAKEATPSLPYIKARNAHELGYRWASSVRDHLGTHLRPLAPVGEIDNVLTNLGWAPAQQDHENPWAEGPLLAAVERSASGACVAVTPERSHAARRFNLARAVFLRQQCGPTWARRLVTRAHTWDQRASRAFAAEFLAPSAGIAAFIGSGSDQIPTSQMDDLADHYDVQQATIRHQVENHRLGWISDY